MITDRTTRQTNNIMAPASAPTVTICGQNFLLGDVSQLAFSLSKIYDIKQNKLLDGGNSKCSPAELLCELCTKLAR